MQLWIKCTRNGADNYSFYDGMDQDTVTVLLTGLGCTDIVFLSQDDWNAQQGI